MIDPNSTYAQGSKLKFDGYWKLISPVYKSTNGSIIDRAVSHTSGITENEAYTFTRSIGYKFSAEVGLSFAKVT